MTENQVNNLTNICIRYNELNILSFNAADTIIKVRSKTPKGLISEEEFNTLSQAMKIMWKITNKTTKEEAIKYFEELEKLQQS
jgi:hypothetical protein